MDEQFIMQDVKIVNTPLGHHIKILWLCCSNEIYFPSCRGLGDHIVKWHNFGVRDQSRMCEDTLGF